MTCYIILNGEWLNDYKIEDNSLIFVTDGALEFCKKNAIIPNKIIGDFDSLGYIPSGAIVYPRDKDYTDGELALNLAKDAGVKEIVFLCAGGHREDHFLCNLSLLQMANSYGIKAKMVTNYSQIYFTEDEINLNVELNSFVSVIPVLDTVVESSLGLKYKYENTKVSRVSTLGISNIAVCENISLTISSGAVYLIVNKEKYK